MKLLKIAKEWAEETDFGYTVIAIGGFFLLMCVLKLLQVGARWLDTL